MTSDTEPTPYSKMCNLESQVSQFARHSESSGPISESIQPAKGSVVGLWLALSWESNRMSCAHQVNRVGMATSQCNSFHWPTHIFRHTHTHIYIYIWIWMMDDNGSSEVQTGMQTTKLYHWPLTLHESTWCILFNGWWWSSDLQWTWQPSSCHKSPELSYVSMCLEVLCLNTQVGMHIMMNGDNGTNTWLMTIMYIYI